MSPYQERIMGLLARGWKLRRVERWAQFGRRPLVWVLVTPEGTEDEVVRQPTVDKLVEMGAVEDGGTR